MLRLDDEHGGLAAGAPSTRSNGLLLPSFCVFAERHFVLLAPLHFYFITLICFSAFGSEISCCARQLCYRLNGFVHLVRENYIVSEQAQLTVAAPGCIRLEVAGHQDLSVLLLVASCLTRG